ncbi:MAG: hypothetical protein JRH19_15560 [Deltaproteobacteria bacterium]|nr:hypothetical protein [Deltaproteobacteria bacterium]
MGLALSVVMASALYASTWHAFYDTREGEARERSARIAADIELLARTTRAADPSDAALRDALRDYLSRLPALVTVARPPAGASAGWLEASSGSIDPTRTLLEARFEVKAGEEASERLEVRVRESIRPRLVTALGRAWSWSLASYREDPSAWRSRRLYNRSLPLYGYWLVVLAVGFGTVRALHRDQLELARLDEEARVASQEFAGLRDEHAAEVESTREQLRQREKQRDEALRQRESLAAEIVHVEEEYAAASRSEDPALGHTATLDRLRIIAERKSRIEQELADHDRQVAGYEGELSETRSQLEAAEELLDELETRRGELEEKLSTRSSEIRKLQGLLREVQKATETTRIDRARLSREIASRRSAQADSSRDRLEEQLGRWIRSPGSAKLNFSQHSRAVRVEEQFQRIDRDFVDRYFTRVTNPEYERGARRLIRVNTNPPTEDRGATGELIVALDDDAGRTLGLHYELRGDAPDPDQVGFVLALLLRSHCRDFRSFAIRTR